MTGRAGLLVAALLALAGSAVSPGASVRAATTAADSPASPQQLVSLPSDARGGEVAASSFELDPSGRPRLVASSRGADLAMPYIVELAPAFTAETAIGRVERALGSPMSVRHTYKHVFNGFAARLTPLQVAALRRDPGIERLVPDVPVSVDTSEPAPSWGLDRIDQRNLPLSGTYDYTDEAAGATAYVIDTGIYAANVDFGARVRAGVSTVPGDTSTSDCHGHGTHVAGTIGGTVYGIAKSVTLVPVRVLNCAGSGYDSDIIAGIDWMIDDHAAGVPAVANMSLGGSAYQPLNDAVRKAVDDGIVMVVAAGNSSADACGFSPASEPSALTVAATDASDVAASFSNTGACVDLFAPGVDIVSDGIAGPTATATMSGTSMAAPHVSGIAAIFAQRYPGASVASLESAILDAATPGAVDRWDTVTPNLLAYLPPKPAAPAQTIVFDPPNLYVESGPIQLTAVASSGLAVSITSLTPDTCRIVGKTATPVKPGACELLATQAGDATWDPASALRQTTVYQRPQTLSFQSWGDFEVGEYSSPSITASSGLAVQFTGLTPATCAVEGARVRGVLRGVCFIRASQPGNAVYGPADDILLAGSVVPARQTVTPPALSQVVVGSTVGYSGVSSQQLPVDVTSLTPATCTADGASLSGLAAGTCDLSLAQAGTVNLLPSTGGSITPVSPDAALFTSVAVEPSGRPVVAYTIENSAFLVVCGDAACTTHTDRTVVDAAGLLVEDIALAVSPAGRPVLAYSLRTQITPAPGSNVSLISSIHVLTCADADCGTWADELVDDADGATQIRSNQVSIGFTVAGMPLIAFSGQWYEGFSPRLGVGLLWCGDLSCQGRHITDIAVWPTVLTDNTASLPSVAVDAYGIPAVSYVRPEQPEGSATQPWGAAVIARCLDTACAAMRKTDLGPAMSFFRPAIVIPADARPVVFWTDNLSPHDDYPAVNWVVRSARCATAGCASVTATVFDTNADVDGRGWSWLGGDISAVIGSSGLPVVAYFGVYQRDALNRLDPRRVVVRRCFDPECTRPVKGFLGELGDTGSFYNRAAPKLASQAGGAVALSYASVPAHYAGSDPAILGVQLGLCRTDDCAVHGAVDVVEDPNPPQVVNFTTSVVSPTRATTLTFQLAFAAAVTGLTSGDFTVGGTSAGWSVTGLSGSGSTYTITVHASAPTDGTVALALRSGSVLSGAGRSGPAADVAAPVVAIDVTPPAVGSFLRTGGGYSTMTFRLSFLEPVSGLSLADISVTGTSPGWQVTQIGGSGKDYTVTINAASPGNGTVALVLRARGAVDAAGNAGPPAPVTSPTTAYTVPVVRYSGANRFATAADVSSHTFTDPSTVDAVYIAYAYNFPDALAGAAAAGSVHGPVLLANTSGALDPSTVAELTRLHPKKIVVLGSEGVIGPTVFGALKTFIAL